MTNTTSRFYLVVTGVPVLASALCLVGCQTKATSSERAQARREAVSELEVPPSQVAQFFAPAGGVAVRELIRVGTDLIPRSFLLVPDQLSHTVRRVEVSTGFVSTLAGTPGVFGTSDQRLRRPTAVAASGQEFFSEAAEVFVADTGNHLIRRITVDHRLETVAGTAAQSGYSASGLGKFASPQGIAIGNFGESVTTLFVADTDNAVIRKINLGEDPEGPGYIELVAGTPGQHGFADAAVGSAALFEHPTGLAYQPNFKRLYVADTGNHVVRVIDLSAGQSHVSTLGGTPGVSGHQDGALGQSLFAQPVGLALQNGGETLFVADRASYAIRAIDAREPGLGTVVTVAGRPWEKGATDGSAATARFRAPSGVASLNDVTYVFDTGNNLIRSIAAKDSGVLVSSVTGTRAPGTRDGYPPSFSIGSPTAIDCDGGRLFINGAGLQQITLDPDANGGAVRVINSAPWSQVAYAAGGIHREHAYHFERMDVTTGVSTFPTVISDPDKDNQGRPLACDDAIFSELTLDAGDQHSIWRFTFDATGWHANYVPGVTRGLNQPSACDNGRIYFPRLDGVPGLASFDSRQASPTLSSIPVPGLSNVFALAASGPFAYFTNGGQHVHRIELASGAITTFAAAAAFEAPKGLCVSGSNLFVADSAAGAVWRADLATGAAVKIALRRLN